MRALKVLIVATMPFILSACASAISRQHNFEVVESKSITSDCKIQSWDRRAIVPVKDGKLYILVQNSSRVTWVGIPFIPFIPTFANGDQLDSLRLDVAYRDKNGQASSDLPTKGWILNLDDKDIEGKATVHQYETAAGK